MRQPRAPRAPRAPRNGAGEAAGAIPPPGFFAPLRGFAAFGGSPQPPRRVGSAPSEAAAQPAPTQPAPPPAPAAEAFAPPAGPAIAAEAGNEWAARTQQGEPWAYRRPRQPQPQGETQLVHAWLHVLTVRKVPPQACTIWLTRVDPQPTYDLYVPGIAVLGEHADRSLYEHVSNNRRQRDVAERFVGRIRAQAADGSPCELGGGELYLPPALPSQQGPAWSSPQAPGGGWSQVPPFGSWPPYGAPPWAGGGMGMPPWWGPTSLSDIAARALQPPQPPPAVQADPASLQMWKSMGDTNQAMLKAFLDVATRQPAQAPPAPAAAPAPDPFEQLTRVITLYEKLRGPPAENHPQVNVIKVDEDTTLVTNKDGDIDPGATAWANLKGVKGIVQGLRSMRANPSNGTNGPQPPKRQALPTTNGAAKANGSS